MTGRRFTALRGAGERLMLMGRPSEAERYLSRVLQYEPQDIETHTILAEMLQLEGRSWESRAHVAALIRSGRFTRDHLRMIGAPELMRFYEDLFINRCASAAPDDPLPWICQARVLFGSNLREEAEKLLRRVVERAPEQAEAQSLLGEILADRGAADEFLRWHEALPTVVELHPRLWNVRGAWAERQGQLREAARCYAEALQRYPDSFKANQRLSQILAALGERELAERFAARGRLVADLEARLRESSAGPEEMRHVADALERLGRNWEAAGWHYIALLARPDLDWPRREFQRVSAKVRRNRGQDSDTALVSLLNLHDYPLPDWHAGNSAALASAESTAATPIAFADVAAAAGLNHRYYNGVNPGLGRAYMFEFNGGGVAVLDYDADGWPDIYLTQGCKWPVNRNDHEHRNQLFRNLGNGTFQNVTDEAGVGDNQFGQGATAGDFNNDGYPDLYISNIGANVLYENLGDGTFRDVTESSGTGGNHWTSSSAMADLNGDSWPDVYTVTYLAGDVYERMCGTKEKPQQCADHVSC